MSALTIEVETPKSPDEMSDKELLDYLEAENGKVTPLTGEKIRPEQTTYIVGTELRSDIIQRECQFTERQTVSSVFRGLKSPVIKYTRPTDDNLS